MNISSLIQATSFFRDNKFSHAKTPKFDVRKFPPVRHLVIYQWFFCLIWLGRQCDSRFLRSFACYIPCTGDGLHGSQFYHIHCTGKSFQGNIIKIINHLYLFCGCVVV